jgi:hypothetical protein
MNDGHRFKYAMRHTVGHRLAYKELAGKEGETEASEGDAEARAEEF